MNPTFEIESYKGIGPIRLGMTIAEVRSVLRTEVRPFKKGPTSTFPTDAFDEFGVHVYYKAPGICEAVEVGLPCNPTFEGHRLVGKQYSEIRELIKTRDPFTKEDSSGLIAPSLGISIYAPGFEEEPGVEVEGVMVFEKGYYD